MSLWTLCIWPGVVYGIYHCYRISFGKKCMKCQNSFQCLRLKSSVPIIIALITFEYFCTWSIHLLLWSINQLLDLINQWLDDLTMQSYHCRWYGSATTSICGRIAANPGIHQYDSGKYSYYQKVMVMTGDSHSDLFTVWLASRYVWWVQWLNE